MTANEEPKDHNEDQEEKSKVELPKVLEEIVEKSSWQTQ